jgi:hypothetical protein
VNQVLRDAIELRASDIHLEPFEDEFRIRYRIDGELQDVSVPAQLKRFQPAIVSRVKILSHLNIAEKRLPQDGRISLKVAGRSVSPTSECWRGSKSTEYRSTTWRVPVWAVSWGGCTPRACIPGTFGILFQRSIGTKPSMGKHLTCKFPEAALSVVTKRASRNFSSADRRS